MRCTWEEVHENMQSQTHVPWPFLHILAGLYCVLLRGTAAGCFEIIGQMSTSKHLGPWEHGPHMWPFWLKLLNRSFLHCLSRQSNCSQILCGDGFCKWDRAIHSGAPGGWGRCHWQDVRLRPTCAGKKWSSGTIFDEWVGFFRMLDAVAWCCLLKASAGPKMGRSKTQFFFAADFLRTSHAKAPAAKKARQRVIC